MLATDLKAVIFDISFFKRSVYCREDYTAVELLTESAMKHFTSILVHQESILASFSKVAKFGSIFPEVFEYNDSLFTLLQHLMSKVVKISSMAARDADMENLLNGDLYKNK